MNICIFGDSITEGYYDEEKKGWVERLGLKLLNDEIYNFGISGDTTEDLLRRFDADVSGKDPQMIIFAIGVNDSIYIPKENRNFVEFGKFKENAEELIEKARQVCEKIVFVGLVTVDEELLTPMPWEPALHYLNKDIEKYDDAMREICLANKLPFIDINSKMKKIDYKKLLSDGIHPNSLGHAWLAEIIAKDIVAYYQK